MAYATVSAADLVAHCMRYYDEKWGYIYGAYGQIWTQAAQDKTTDEQARKWGQQWVGRHVIDCSGVWWLAMKELGSFMYHGSNTMWNKYTVARGALRGGKRTDGGELRIGTAIYTGNDTDGRNHVGIYIGNNQVLEAGGTQKGVILTAVTASKWTWWAEMKYVDYGAEPTPAPGPSPEPAPAKLPTLRKGDRGQYVQLLQTKLINKGYSCGSSGADGIFGNDTLYAVKKFQLDAALEMDGICGAKTWAALDSSAPIQTYTVHIPFLPKYKAEALISQYTGASMTPEESGK